MRITFASLGSLGDLNPLLALADGMRRRGHDAAVAAGPFFRENVTSQGFEFFPLRPHLEPAPELVGHLSHPRLGPERMLREQIFPSSRETYEDLLTACHDTDALVVGELLYVAPLVAAKRNIPWANVVLSPSSFLSATDPCVLAPAPGLDRLRIFGRWPHRLVLQAGRFFTWRWSRPLRELRVALGFPAGPNAMFEGKHSRDLTLTLFPAFFAAPQPDWPDSVRQTGFPFFKQPRDEEGLHRLDAFFDAVDPPIVFTLGSTAVYIAKDFYRLAARAAERLGRRAILLLGDNRPPDADPNRILSLKFAPLDVVLPRAAAVVHHGGIGGCAESLRAGVPSFIIPFGYDQPDNAERMRKLGVARVGQRHRISEQTLMNGVAPLLNDASFRNHAAKYRRQIQPESDMESNLDALERLSNRGC